MSRPEIVRTSAALRRALSAGRAAGSAVGFVPTMGALHGGHVRLVEEAKRHAPFTLVSIFVNPTQFGPNEDLTRYPRDIDGDLAKCEQAGVDVVFIPEQSEMYPPGDDTRVTVGSALSNAMCGPFRPGHFEGVSTVVAKLFALTAPCVAVFGRKDYQQLRVIERMARDLLFDVTIVGVATVRDADGLALSSRNAYLSAADRQRALAIPRGLFRVWSAFSSGERRVHVLEQMMQGELAAAADTIDYVVLADPMTLARRDPESTLTGPTLIAVAARVGKTRLIDNLVLGEDAPPELGRP